MKVALILGNRLADDGSPSDILLSRMTLAERLYSEVKPDIIVLSGGKANKKAGISEAEVMENILIERGIPKGVLIKEDNSLTTRQNAKFSLPIIERLQPDMVYLCSSREHIERKYLNPVRIFKRALKGKNIQMEIFTQK